MVHAEPHRGGEEVMTKLWHYYGFAFIYFGVGVMFGKFVL